MTTLFASGWDFSLFVLARFCPLINLCISHARISAADFPPEAAHRLLVSVQSNLKDFGIHQCYRTLSINELIVQRLIQALVTLGFQKDSLLGN